ncbi:MAG: hypothetical protein ACAH80_17210 [Alphaproteobacteria bacterium]
MKNTVKAMMVGMALLLAGCTEGPPETQTPVLTFSQMQPISINVAQVVVQDKYTSAMKEPYVEHLFKQTPAAAARELVGKQLSPRGPDRLLRVVIEDASVIKEDLKSDDSFMGLFTYEQTERYKGRVALRFELLRNASSDFVLGHAEVVADRVITLMEDASPAEREMAFFRMNEGMMQDLYKGLQTTVQTTFGRE